MEPQIIEEGSSVDIKCSPSQASMVIWFRVLDKGGMQFIVSFDQLYKKKAESPSFSSFGEEKIKQNILVLKSFNKATDSGTYSCASLNKNQLNFGDVTRLVGPEPKLTTKAPPSVTTQLMSSTSTTACVCSTKKVEKKDPSLVCDSIILGPLAGSCGLLLLLLIITICYCNRIRTRRCPHHHKRRPRMPPGRQPMPNRHV